MVPGMSPSIATFQLALPSTEHFAGAQLYTRGGERTGSLPSREDTVHICETDTQKDSEQKRKGAAIQRGLTSVLGWLPWAVVSVDTCIFFLLM